MKLLRIYGSLQDPPLQCRWALFNGAVGKNLVPATGAGRLAELPRADRVQLVIPAAQVLITRANLPQAARRRGGTVLAYAVEEKTVGDPEGNAVCWLGSTADTEVLAVVDRLALARWRDALSVVGMHAYEVHCETLLLPWVAGEWSVAWDGSEGYVRTGALEGAATDRGDHVTPPLALHLMLEERSNARPNAITLYVTTPNATPDIAAWQRSLGVSVRVAGTWDWRTASPDAGVVLMRERQGARALGGIAARLRPAAWIVAGALAIHTIALVTDWAVLAAEHSQLRQQMEARFRATFPDAVAVVDPALQMRRKLAEARHASGRLDSGDFLPLLEQVAAGMKDLPAGSVRAASYEGGRMTIELGATEEAAVRRAVARLRETGLNVDVGAPTTRTGTAGVIITVRSS